MSYLKKIMTLSAICTLGLVLVNCKDVSSAEDSDLQGIANIKADGVSKAPLCENFLRDVDLDLSKRNKVVQDWLAKDGTLSDSFEEKDKNLATTLLTNLPYGLLKGLAGYGTRFEIHESTPTQCQADQWDNEDDKEFATAIGVDASKVCFHAEENGEPVIYFIGRKDTAIDLTALYGQEFTDAYGKDKMLEIEFLLRTQLIRISGLIYSQYIMSSRLPATVAAVKKDSGLKLVDSQTKEGLLTYEKHLQHFNQHKLKLVEILVGTEKQSGEIEKLSQQYSKLASTAGKDRFANYVVAEAIDSFYCSNAARDEFFRYYNKTAVYFAEHLLGGIE